jgi:hypothetical protein
MIHSASQFVHSKDTHLDFLKEAYYLLIFAYEDLKVKGYDVSKKNENKIRDDLVQIAKKEGVSTKLRFITEFPDLKNNSRIDIQLITPLSLNDGEKSDITIECKIIGESKYINNNGICSFSSNKYASEMPLAGMIGFIKEGDISHKIEHLKHLLDNHPDIITDQNLEPYEFESNFKESYKSKHQRKGNKPIVLYHLFFDFVIEPYHKNIKNL